MSDKPSTLVLERAEWIFKGDPGESLYLIKSGMVQIKKEINGTDVTLATLSDNEVFGEMVLFSDLPRSASAQAGCGHVNKYPKSFIRGKFDPLTSFSAWRHISFSIFKISTTSSCFASLTLLYFSNSLRGPFLFGSQF